ncbi:MAG: DNA mismatch repair endonuclease MutL [Deltaproteobacteria bacterium]|jgi:DNA mismatch repair protein MutL|nr:DNA mismatch repair endonuclease MutL [Deltaproteobacteria bacterium]
MTSRIKLLPENLINRIAAGEVVERPASVLKELLENSLDAGATRIEVDIEAGGKRLIRVSDNGHGLNREELFLCLERHATSKLAPDSDLFAIGTLGFRGEAMPSIASVSRMTVTSQEENQPGHRLTVEGGKILDLSPAATNQGTVVEVRDLFFNVPARRKFLKTEATETAHLIEVTQRYALSRPNLRLRLRDTGREVLSVDEHNDMSARAMKVLGREVASSLRRFGLERDDLKIEGYLSGPEASRANPGLFVFVSGRPVRDKLLNRAIVQGYGRSLPHGRFPSGVVFIDLDPARVDVNVHPAKTEVRFREPGQIFDALAKAVSGAIDVSPLAEPPSPGPGPSAGREIAVSDLRLPRAGPGERDLGLTRFSMGRAPKGGPRLNLTGPPTTPPWMVGETGPSVASPEPKPAPVATARGAGAPEVGTEPGENAIPLAQLHDSYILAQGPLALYVIDQHAAHERILFNSMKQSLSDRGLPSQKLLLPETIELSPQESLAVEKLLKPLQRLGFMPEPFGERAWTLRGIPAKLGLKEAKDAFLEVIASAKNRLRDLDGAGLERVVEELSDGWLYGLACKAAVKAGDRLSHEEMGHLIKSLAKLGAGGYCPHGRPTTIVLKLSDLEARFGRT